MFDDRDMLHHGLWVRLDFEAVCVTAGLPTLVLQGTNSSEVLRYRDDVGPLTRKYFSTSVPQNTQYPNNFDLCISLA
jgi:hypothetical protein